MIANRYTAQLQILDFLNKSNVS